GLRRCTGQGPRLIPLIGFISVGLGSAVLYLLRLALYSPDVSWDRKNNPEPWNKLSPTDQYKVSTGQIGDLALWGGGMVTLRARHHVFFVEAGRWCQPWGSGA
uniref:NDUFA4 mitochondrial complex associated like 2 n=1 Tax=Falco tinnunculus TaxID=100819 RepID=A0A8C4TLR8_FALTI